MLQRIIEYSVRNRFLVILVTLLLIAGGTVALVEIPLDAIPDLSDVQVIVLTEYPGQAPEVVEDQVTYPLTTAMLAVPYAETVRGYSFFGLSFVYIIFEDGTDLYWARSRVLEYLSYVTDRLPPGVNPRARARRHGRGLGLPVRAPERPAQPGGTAEHPGLVPPVRTHLGQRVSEVASIGGFVKQYQVEVDPNKLLIYDIPLNRIKTAIQRSNNDVGGRVVEMAETEYMVRGLGYIESVEDLENVPLGVDGFGRPYSFTRSPGSRRDRNSGGDWRKGTARGRSSAASSSCGTARTPWKVIRNVEEKLESLKSGLPEGVEIITAYDRSNLIERAIDNLSDKLLVESLIVALVCIIFLIHFRSALVVILTLPISVLAAFLVMSWQGINANIMSLGGIAIAIGTLVDAAIVMIENTHKHMERDRGKKDHWQIVLDAAKEVGPSLFYSLLIITLSFAPIFALQAQEGRLFKPLAFTKTYTMAAAALLAITFVPVVTGYLVRGRLLPERRNPLSRLLVFLYRPVIRAAIRVRWLTIGVAVIALSATWYPLQRIGSEFMPPLYEGDLLYMPTTDPGISITKARQLLQQTDRIIRSFPEVERVFGKVGTGGNGDRSRAAVHDRDHHHAQARGGLAAGHDARGARGGAQRRHPVPGADQCVDHAHSHADRHAVHGDPDSGRHQDHGRRPGRAVGPGPAGRRRTAGTARHAQRLSREDPGRQLPRLRDRPRRGGALRDDRGRRAGCHHVGGGRGGRDLHGGGIGALPGKYPLRQGVA